MSNLSIGKRILSLILASGVLLLVLAGVSTLHQRSTVDALKAVYEERTVPLTLLGDIGELLSDNTLELTLTAQHDPQSPLAVAHDHPIEVHLERFVKRRAEINSLWEKYMAIRHSDEESRLAADFAAKRKVWVEKAAAMLDRMKGGDFSPAMLTETLNAIRNEGEAASNAHNALVSLQVRLAKESYEQELGNMRAASIEFILLIDRKSTRLNSSHRLTSRMPSSA
jgi:hypothetical protein